MVRLINDKNLWVLKSAAVKWMSFQKHHTHVVEINNQNSSPCIYAFWHANQCCIFGVKNKHNTSIMISRSMDGEIVATGVESLGIKVVRGSSNRQGSVEATMQLIDRLKAGEDAALTIDGPAGPYHKVKNGVIKIAKLSGCPIIPVTWYSDQWCFLTLPSWDKMTLPIWDTNLINLYGEPIYVPSDLPDSEFGTYKERLSQALDDLDKRAPEEYKKIKEKKLWKTHSTPI